jgi:hypothetical protein
MRVATGSASARIAEVMVAEQDGMVGAAAAQLGPQPEALLPAIPWPRQEPLVGLPKATLADAPGVLGAVS